MPSYDDFGPHVEAHLLYLWALSPQEALDALGRRLADDTWRKSPKAWITRFMNVAHQPDVPAGMLADLRRALVDALEKLDVGTESHQVLAELLRSSHGATVVEIDRIVTWFVENGQPKDAGLAASMLEALDRRRRDEPSIGDRVTPLARWLVTNGSGELRSRGRARLTITVAKRLWEGTADPVLLRQSLRIVLGNEVALGAMRLSDKVVRELFVLVENAVESGDHELVIDMALAGPEGWTAGNAEGIVGKEGGWPELAICRAALIEAAAAGALPHAVATAVWTAALWTETFPDASLVFSSTEAVAIALDALRDHAAFGDRKACPKREGPWADRWARCIASEYIRIFELTSPRTPARNRVRELSRVVGYSPKVDAGVRQALSDALERTESNDVADLVRAIIADDLGARCVKAALRVLEEHPAVPQVATSKAWPEVEMVLRRLLDHPFAGPIGGVDMPALLRGVSRLRIEELDSDDKVRIEAPTLIVHRPALESLLELPFDADGHLALAAMYLAHELAHVAQCVGDKRVVTNIRATGFAGETNLMHIDLGADHAAALVVHAAFPRWDLLFLKQLQCRSLAAFPPTPEHSAPGRYRKALRAAGLHVDYILRSQGQVHEKTLAGAYAFTDFGPAGGELIVLTSGPPFRVIGSTSLSAGEAETLLTSRDPGRPPSHR